MSDFIKAEIVADSIGPHNKRLTTFVIEYPRFILAEINTHRALSRNTSSSRAIPVNKMIQSIRDNPAQPVFWGANQAGMQASAELEGKELTCAKDIWIEAMHDNLDHAEELRSVGLHKQIANRILEPWMITRTIVSATNWENFFALRAHEDAQPEFQNLAYKMLNAINESEPRHLQYGAWHVPFGDKFNKDRVMEMDLYKEMVNSGTTQLEARAQVMLRIAVARCARVSYLNFEGKDDYDADVKICERLFGSVPRHLSPAEHVAQCSADSPYLRFEMGNFSGFRQYRKFFADEDAKDKRVKDVQFSAHKMTHEKDTDAYITLEL